jgi:hypothetical protein
MVNKTSFIIRLSGIRANSYYIDYLGAYKAAEISELVGIKESVIKEKYILNDGIYNQDLDVYYFSSMESAQNAITEILKGVKVEKKCRIIELTEAEVEYIRQALINEGINTIRVGNKVKDAIFKKLNS